ncbi:hypothetical protein KBA01_01640 [Kozakia baliensis]|nr:hypothetical protein KBA01_01640 [Kozakia baliensis]
MASVALLRGSVLDAPREMARNRAATTDRLSRLLRKRPLHRETGKRSYRAACLRN